MQPKQNKKGFFSTDWNSFYSGLLKYRVLTYVFVAISISVVLSSQAQVADGTYCYYHKETNYVEWLHFENDSVCVIGQLNKTCADTTSLRNGIIHFKNQGDVWDVLSTGKEFQFTKVIDVQAGMATDFSFQIEYLYTGKVKRKKVYIDLVYSPATFRNQHGESSRVYKRIKFD